MMLKSTYNYFEMMTTLLEVINGLKLETNRPR